ncbi:proteophosphoglycan precursor [Rhodovulum viride]|uniref:Proteophosphoglycan n=2 Tax=Rhodovulum viride TaxID=1231134 RepID=A0ABX9DEV7_9RHOB|nr:proteophosphoglycan precursor [Rhodovulum viride]
MAKNRQGQMIVKPVTESLAEAARAASGKGLPPVHLWNPPFCGDIDMRIARDGTWFYLGTPIGRAPLVRLFSTILKREGDRHFLVTPVEKVGITVDDAPFVAVDVEQSVADGEPVLSFTTNVGDRVEAGPGHEIRVTRDPRTGEPAPYLHVRAGLQALIDRKSFYRMAEIGDTVRHEGRDWFGFRSKGLFFPAIPAEELT